MRVEPVKFKSKAWGVTPLPGIPGHYFTGYEHEWGNYTTGTLNRYEYARQHGTPSEQMRIGENVIFRDADFRIDTSRRGRSAANFIGHFRNSDMVPYVLSMDGTGDLFTAIQTGRFPLIDGYVRGDWTIVKQGQNIFLRPLLE
jgi:hypothetical protein